jgi:DNA-binding beta-propeller fold protein YncE
MKNEKFKIIIFVFISICCFLSIIPAREYYITPDGETIYYSPSPRVFLYKPKTGPEKIFSVYVPNGKEPGQVLEPRDVYVDHKDRVYVTDAGAGMVKVFSVLGSLLRRIDVRSLKSEEDLSPGAIAVSPLGEIYVADKSKRKVQVFDFTGRSQGPFSPMHEKEKIDLPEDFAITRDSSLLILDSEKSRIHRYSFRKEWIEAWGAFGDKTGEMNHPRGISLGKNGEICIADTQNHRIEIFWPNGVLIRSFGIKGELPGMLSFPHTIAVDNSGLIAVGDRGGARIQFFSALGDFLGEIRFDREDSGPQEAKAESIAFDGIGALYIIDGLGKRVLKIPPVQINEALE